MYNLKNRKMIKVGFAFVLLILWFFATMLKVNNSTDSGAAFSWKSVFFWMAICIAFALGQMSA